MNENVPLVVDLVRRFGPASPEAVWMIATVPVDPLVYLIHPEVPLEEVFRGVLIFYCNGAGCLGAPGAVSTAGHVASESCHVSEPP
ncbi:MAG: hypothetical protein ACOC9D_03745 [Thermodesulfobacteriota bacterium]